MTFLEILLTIAVAVLVGLLFYYVFKSTGPWGSFWTFLLILILAGLAAEAWVTPVGPVYYDFAWLPTLFVILLFALILAAATPTGRSNRDIETSRTTTETEPTGTSATAVALGVFFWFLLIFLFIAVLVGVFV